MSAKTWAAVVAVAVAGLCGGARADVTGKVTLDGKAPEMKVIDMSGVAECNKQHPDPITEETVVVGEKGELANVVVYVKKEEGQEIAGADKTPDAAELDQEGCQYKPHVLPVMVGQDITVKNNDAFLHNVHSMAQENPAFNFGQPNKDPGKKIDPMKTAETFKVKCDVHPWMLAWIKVFDHPFFATTGEDGTYTLKGLPDGEYTLVAWQEKYGDSEPQKVTVKDGKATADFKFKAESATGPTAPVAEVKLASLTSGCEKDGACCEESCPADKKPAAAKASVAAAKE